MGWYTGVSYSKVDPIQLKAALIVTGEGGVERLSRHYYTERQAGCYSTVKALGTPSTYLILYNVSRQKYWIAINLLRSQTPHNVTHKTSSIYYIREIYKNLECIT